MRTIIRNATIVNEGRKFVGSVVIEDEIIQQVLEGDDSTQTYDLEIDATGLYLFPGVIDDHVHFREPGLTYKDCERKQNGCGWRCDILYGDA